jgi:acetoin utilization deacetylase AcuC-like enzyme
MGPGHPESPDRLRAICTQLQSSGTWSRLHQVKPRRAERQWIELIHQGSYVESLEHHSPVKGYASLDPDTSMSPGTLDAAYLAAGGALAAVDAIMNGDIDQAFCAVRPPGHHAEADRAMGFCFFNSVAIAARYIQQQYGLQRVLIVDWDVHHGNGTQHAFYDDASVLFFSTHQFPYYPGTGGAMETGEGRGKGLTINVPLAGGQGDDGFDAHRDDPLASMDLTEEGYGELTSMVASIAKNFSRGRVLACLEGGYHLQALAGSVDQHLQALLDS